MATTLGIRREDKNEWERRVPLTPTHVARLVRAGLNITIQPSSIRVFPDAEYVEAGATLQEDLSSCGLVLAVKEIPLDFFKEKQAYLFFSHVSKGQPDNMPMLARMLERRATLVDYEHVVDERSRRLIFFGNHAGSAGLLETLYALGKRLEWEGYSTPFSGIRRGLELSGLGEARSLLEDIGSRISSEGLGLDLAPVVVGFAGYGNVSAGAQELFDLLPHEEILPQELVRFMSTSRFSDRKLYKVIFHERDMVTAIEGATFDLQDYYQHPDGYRSDFERYLPHLTVLINCIYWEERYPQFLTKKWLRSAWAGNTRPRLRVIGDITCDIEGSMECTVKATGPGNPTYTYLPSSGETVDGWEGAGPVVMAVDTLPAEFPREASASFADMLMGFVPKLTRADFSGPFDDLLLGTTLKRAVIAYQGELTERYRYLEAHIH